MADTQHKSRLTKASRELLGELRDKPLRLRGIGSAIAAQGLIDRDYARAVGGVMFITDAGRALLSSLSEGE